MAYPLVVKRPPSGAVRSSFPQSGAPAQNGFGAETKDAGRATPRHAAPRHATSRHAALRHAAPRHAAPRHAAPRHEL